jgi:aldose 1-epimerase
VVFVYNYDKTQSPDLETLKSCLTKSYSNTDGGNGDNDDNDCNGDNDDDDSYCYDSDVRISVVSSSGSVIMFQINGDTVPQIHNRTCGNSSSGGNNNNKRLKTTNKHKHITTAIAASDNTSSIPDATTPDWIHIAQRLPVTPTTTKPVVLRTANAATNATATNATAKDIAVTISPYGATLMSYAYNGKELILTNSTLDEQMADECYMGSTVGRVSNRISKGVLSYSVDGVRIDRQLDVNNGVNHLHGGVDGFNKRVWCVIEKSDCRVTLGLTSDDGDQGYSGKVFVTVTYTLHASGLDITFNTKVISGVAVVGLTNHCYWNMNDNKNQSVYNHRLQMFCDGYLPVDDTSIPTRVIQRPEEGEKMYLEDGRTLGDVIEGLREEGDDDHAGVDHNYIVRKHAGEIFDGDTAAAMTDDTTTTAADDDTIIVDDTTAVKCAELSCGSTLMTMYTSYPGCQVYTGNWLSDPFVQYGGVALEGQYYPDCVSEGVEGRGRVWAGKAGESRREVICYRVGDVAK